MIGLCKTLLKNDPLFALIIKKNGSINLSRFLLEFQRTRRNPPDS